MLDRTAPNPLGSLDDNRAYSPPKPIHRANPEATIGPNFFRHDE